MLAGLLWAKCTLPPQECHPLADGGAQKYIHCSGRKYERKKIENMKLLKDHTANSTGRYVPPNFWQNFQKNICFKILRFSLQKISRVSSLR